MSERIKQKIMNCLPLLVNSGWEVLKNYFYSNDFERLCDLLQQREDEGANIIPKVPDIFRSLFIIRPERIKVVFVGPPPFPQPGYSRGLACGLAPHIKNFPKDLKHLLDDVDRSLIVEERGDLFLSNEYESKHIITNKEIKNACLTDRYRCTLEGWVRQGVLMLPSIMTTESRTHNAHREFGWEKFTDFIVSYLARQDRPTTIFLLWGYDALEKERVIKASFAGGINCDSIRHPIFLAPIDKSGPKNGFMYYYFARINNELTRMGQSPINWRETN